MRAPAPDGRDLPGVRLRALPAPTAQSDQRGLTEAAAGMRDEGRENDFAEEVGAGGEECGDGPAGENQTNQMNMDPSQFTGTPNVRQGAPYEDRWVAKSIISIPVLNFLWGSPWDMLALASAHALRPSHIRVVEHGTQMDSQLWRVTVYLKRGRIDRIEQEVEVGLPPGVYNGYELRRITPGL